MTLEGHYALFQTCAYFGAHTKIWLKIDPYYREEDVAQWLYRFWQYKVYADIRGGSQDLC